MATINTCDGTGVPIPDSTPVTGVLGNQYCDDARPLAQKYLDDLNDLHTQVAQQFQTRLNELRAAYHEKLKKLPDEY